MKNMKKITIKRTGAKPVEVGMEDFDQAMGERIYRHWEETHSVLNIDINEGEKQFAIVPRNQKDWYHAVQPVEKTPFKSSGEKNTKTTKQ